MKYENVKQGQLYRRRKNGPVCVVDELRCGIKLTGNKSGDIVYPDDSENVTLVKKITVRSK